MHTTKTLFISYSGSDAVKVDKIAHDLRLLKHDDGTPRYLTWQDKHNLPPASPNWWDAIVDAIIACDIFVFNLSVASLQSKVCQAELEYAYKRNRHIIPIVLQDEFILNAQSGKYDLPRDTWVLLPDWLGETQLFFHTGADFYGKFQDAVAVCERNPLVDIPAPRPLNPDKDSEHGNNFALYDAACDYAERLAFADAQKHFHTLVRRNDLEFAAAAREWLEIIHAYTELIEIKTRPRVAFKFDKKWETYLSRFPVEFLDGIFDPKNFANTPPPQPPPSTRADVKPPPRVEVIQTPPQRIITPPPLPAPFAWMEIPGGRGTMKTSGSGSGALEIPTETYWMSKYPITNAQYTKFIEAGGYQQEKWWTVQGWELRQSENWTIPRFWDQDTFKGAHQPVVSLSWFEAVAFCLWLSDVTDEEIMLPTEAQWQYAAQGSDGHAYPWGSNWDAGCCNNSVVKGIGKTTPVTHYEGINGRLLGESPFGVVDMAGNVWEWCLTDYNNVAGNINNDITYVVRGGSWSDYNAGNFRCDACYRSNPQNRSNDYGFRVARS